MTEEDLRKANRIQKEIDEIESFIRTAEKVWTGKLIKQSTKYIFKSSQYGIMESEELHLDTVLKNKVLDVIREELSELKKQLNEI